MGQTVYAIQQWHESHDRTTDSGGYWETDLDEGLWSVLEDAERRAVELQTKVLDELADREFADQDRRLHTWSVAKIAFDAIEASGSPDPETDLSRALGTIVRMKMEKPEIRPWDEIKKELLECLSVEARGYSVVEVYVWGKGEK